jgi:hypothetical protein
MTAKDTVSAGVELIERLARDKLAQVQMLEARENALTLTIKELQERVGVWMHRAEAKKEFDQLRDRARAFADALDARGY